MVAVVPPVRTSITTCAFRVWRPSMAHRTEDGHSLLLDWKVDEIHRASSALEMLRCEEAHWKS